MLWLYGIAWNSPALPRVVIIGCGLVTAACALALRALAPPGTAQRRLASLDPTRQERLRAINRRAYLPMFSGALSFASLGFGDAIRAHLKPATYQVFAVSMAVVLVLSVTYLYSLRLAERRLYAERPSG